jgi:hypothetical protein
LAPGPDVVRIERDIARGSFPLGMAQSATTSGGTDLPPDRCQLLSSIPLFRGMSRSQLAWIDVLVDDLDMYPGDVLMRERERGHQAFVIVAGTAEVNIDGRTVA